MNGREGQKIKRKEEKEEMYINMQAREERGKKRENNYIGKKEREEMRKEILR